MVLETKTPSKWADLLLQGQAMCLWWHAKVGSKLWDFVSSELDECLAHFDLSYCALFTSKGNQLCTCFPASGDGCSRVHGTFNWMQS